MASSGRVIAISCTQESPAAGPSSHVSKSCALGSTSHEPANHGLVQYRQRGGGPLRALAHQRTRLARGRWDAPEHLRPRRVSPLQAPPPSAFLCPWPPGFPPDQRLELRPLGRILCKLDQPRADDPVHRRQDPASGLVARQNFAGDFYLTDSDMEGAAALYGAPLADP